MKHFFMITHAFNILVGFDVLVTWKSFQCDGLSEPTGLCMLPGKGGDHQH